MSQIHNQLDHSAELLGGISVAAGLGRDKDGVIRLGESLEPILDPFSLPEWAYLRAERLGAGRGFQPAVAAEFSIIALGNAAGSGNLVVVESVNILSTVTTQLEVAADSLVAATLGAAAFYVSGRDRRFGSTQGRTFLKIGSDLASTFGVQLEQQAGAAGVFNSYISTPIVLKPGDDLLIIAQTINTAIQCNWKWRERKAFTGELPAA